MKPLTGIGVALVSAIIFGTSGSFAKSLLEAGWSTGAAVTWRMTGAGLVLLIPAILALRGQWRILLANWKPILLFGAFGVAACQLAYFHAVERLSVGVALMLEYLAPVMIVLILWIQHRKAPRAMTIAGTILAFGGLVLVLNLGASERIDFIGVLWGLVAAVGLVVYFFVTAEENDTLPPIVLATAGLFVGAAIMGLAGLLRIIPMETSFVDVTLAGAVVPWWVALLGLILISTAFAYVTGIMAARALGSKVASFVSLFEVVAAVLWAWLFLGELPLPIQLLGGLLIFAGVVLVRWDELRSEPTDDDHVMPSDYPIPGVPAETGAINVVRASEPSSR